MGRRRSPGRSSIQAHRAQTVQWDQLHQEEKRWLKILKEVETSLGHALDRYVAAKAAYEAAIVDMRQEHADTKATPR